MPKVLRLKQLLLKKHKLLEGLNTRLRESVGDLVEGFIMIVWGQSSSGKSEFLMQIIQEFMKYGKVLYVGLEEGHSNSMQVRVVRNFKEAVNTNNITFADHEMTYENLLLKLKKKKSPKFIVIDSLQYWNITYENYKKLKELFPKKSFIFISHAAGKYPAGSTADKIRYDAGVKIRVENFIAFVGSRYGGNKNYVIWEEGAKNKWGYKQFKKLIR